MDRWREERGGIRPRALILGATPELLTLDWHPAPTAVPLEAWRDVPLPPASCDIALCDGGMRLLPYPEEQFALLERLHRALAPGGRAVFRLFARSPVNETAADVLRALIDGRIPDPPRLRLRLWSALQQDPRQGISPASARQTLRDLAGTDHESLTEPLDADRDWQARQYLLTPGEAVQLFTAAGFRRQATIVPTYPLGRQCPTLVFART